MIQEELFDMARERYSEETIAKKLKIDDPFRYRSVASGGLPLSFFECVRLSQLIGIGFFSVFAAATATVLPGNSDDRREILASAGDAILNVLNVAGMSDDEILVKLQSKNIVRIFDLRTPGALSQCQFNRRAFVEKAFTFFMIYKNLHLDYSFDDVNGYRFDVLINPNTFVDETSAICQMIPHLCEGRSALLYAATESDPWAESTIRQVFGQYAGFRVKRIA